MFSQLIFQILKNIFCMILLEFFLEIFLELFKLELLWPRDSYEMSQKSLKKLKIAEVALQLAKQKLCVIEAFGLE